MRVTQLGHNSISPLNHGTLEISVNVTLDNVTHFFEEEKKITNQRRTLIFDHATEQQLRSVIAQCRNFYTSRSSREWKREMFLIRGPGMALGLGLGYIVVGGNVSELEADRRQWTGDHVDLRKKMWPELKDKEWFRITSRMWSESDIRKKMLRMRSDLWESMGVSRSSDLWQEKMWDYLTKKMWYDLWKSMWSDRS